MKNGRYLTARHWYLLGFAIALVLSAAAIVFIGGCGHSENGPCDPPDGWAYRACINRGGLEWCEEIDGLIHYRCVDDP